MHPIAVDVLSMAAVEIDLNWSFFVQLGLILALLLVLKPFLFDPMLRVMDERRARTDEARRESRALTVRADELSARYEAEMATARGKAAAAKVALRSEGVVQREAIVGEARSSAVKTLEQVRQTVDRELAAAEAEVGRQVDDIARAVVARILGRSV